MLKKLSSPWIASLIGVVTYLAVTIATWNAATKNVSNATETQVQAAAEAQQIHWLKSNPEVEAMIKGLREEQQALAARRKALDELAERLRSERGELNQLTQALHRMQKDFDASISRVTEEEATNLKKLAKTYSGMEADAASAVFKKLDDAAVVKMMMFMRENESAAILAEMARGGDESAQRVADLTERLRVAVVPKSKK